MSLYERLINKETKLALVGLGYVGMPIAVAFSKKVEVIGFDINKAKIELYKQGIDPTNEVGSEGLKNCTIEFTADEKRLDEAGFIIVAVPTPVNDDHTPDLSPVEGASHIAGRHLNKGDIVVFESTVYPGVTEEVCVPIMEQESGLKCGEDFFVGYSPERINPGDKVHRLETITKIVSGMDEETLDTVAKVYELEHYHQFGKSFLVLFMFFSTSGVRLQVARCLPEQHYKRHGRLCTQDRDHPFVRGMLLLPVQCLPNSL